MMEVTPHLKSVLKNYQNSATKSLQGPGLGLVPTKIESSPIEEEEFVPPPFPVQQVPILTTPDTSCSERTETNLEGESISCFVVGGEKRLCLPQVLNSVLRDFSLNQINQECDQLQIYCSRCTSEQLNVLKNQGILPSSAASSGLITKTDAERLCSALLYGQTAAPLRPRKGATSFAVYHKCFGKCRGVCFPELFTSKTAKCIECTECQSGFTPQQFVCHVHNRHFSENRTVHWGFDSVYWRAYLKVCRDQPDHEQYIKYLDDMHEQYEGNMPFPLPHNIYSGIKRKQILPSDIIREQRELPLKKQKLEEYLGGVNHIPYGIYASLDPLYLHQYIQECNVNVNRHISAFKPVSHHAIKESKIYQHLMGMGVNRYTDPPVLQNPERVVLMSESERFERTFQPNVALAPSLPKKARYAKLFAQQQQQQQQQLQQQTVKEEPTPIKKEDALEVKVVIKQEIEEKPTETAKAVSVVQSTTNLSRYNSEIELSTDTEDSASDTSEKQLTDISKVEEVLKNVDADVKDRVMAIFKSLMKECEKTLKESLVKSQRIRELETSNTELRQQLRAASSNSVEQDTVDSVENDSAEPVVVVCNGNGTVSEDTSSSIIKSKESCDDNEGQPSVIATLEETTEPKAIINTAPE